MLNTALKCAITRSSQVSNTHAPAILVLIIMFASLQIRLASHREFYTIWTPNKRMSFCVQAAISVRCSSSTMVCLRLNVKRMLKP